MKNEKFIRMLIFICIGFLSSQVWAQNTTPRSKADLQAAPSVRSQSGQTESASLNDLKWSKKMAIEEQKMQKRLNSLQNPPHDQATLLALKAEMDANLNNTNYDLAKSFRLFKGSPLILYPLNHYDSDFPVVIRTGDKIKDTQSYNQAKADWVENKKAQKANRGANQN